MKNISKYFLTAFVSLFIQLTNASASSHREAPLISNDPLADNTDLYAFRSPTNTNRVVLIANYIPFEHPAGGPNWYTFGSNIRYEIHIDNNTATAGDDIIYRFVFSKVNEDPTTFFNIRLGQQNLKTTYTLSRSMNGGSTFTNIVTNGIVPPPNIGPRSIENATVGLGAANYDALMTSAIATATTGEKVYCGPSDDPFFVDLGGAFDVGGFRQNGRDGLKSFNCHSICIEVPISTLQKNGKTVDLASNILDPEFVIGVWANASRRSTTTFDVSTGTESASGNYVQVSRLGMPLTNEVVIPIGTKDKWNSTMPTNDLQYATYFKNPELGLYMDDSQFGGAVPDLVALRIQSKSLGAFDFRNGKKGLWDLKGSAAVAGTALDDALYGTILLPDSVSPRAVDLLPIFYTGVPNVRPYQLATGKNGDPLAAGKPFINNFLPTLGDMLRLNMAVPATPRNSADFSSLGIISAAVLGLTDPRFNTNKNLEMIPNMDGFPNGRRLEDDVTTIELQAVSGVALAAIGLWYDDYIPGTSPSPVTRKLVRVLSFNAGVTKNDTTFKSGFPFVQAPWRGFTGAEYSGTLLRPSENWMAFVAEKNDKDVLLRWNVTGESGNDRYEIEYSHDGSNFSKIGTVKAINSDRNRYDFIHHSNVVAGNKYYRLKQVDVHGRYTYSEIRLIAENTKSVFTISPNPATDRINVRSTESKLTINIYNVEGKKIMTKELLNGNGTLEISKLGRGTYVMTAESNGTKIETKKFIKQ